MQVTKRLKGPYIIYTIIGNLDMNNVKYVRHIFDDSIAHGAKYIAIDMRELKYIDSSGIGSFISLMTKLKEVGGQVVLVNMSNDIERIFSMTKLLAFFKVYKTDVEFYNALGV